MNKRQRKKQWGMEYRRRVKAEKKDAQRNSICNNRLMRILKSEITKEIDMAIIEELKTEMIAMLGVPRGLLTIEEANVLTVRQRAEFYGLTQEFDKFEEEMINDTRRGNQ